jgi:hypothetical protein
MQSRSRATLATGCVLALAGVWLARTLTDDTRIGLLACSALGCLPWLAYGIWLWLARSRGRAAPRPGGRSAVPRPDEGPGRRDRRNLAGLGLLLGAICILLHESLFFGKGLVPVDGITAYEPWRSELGRSVSNPLLADQFLELIPQQQFLHDHIVRGDLPLWNPDLACGLPHVASMQSAPFFPINLLLAPLDPFASRGLAALVKLFLAGLFTFLYVRRLGTSRSAATLSALAFAFSGFMIVWLGHPHSNSAMWLPLLLYLIEGEFSAAGRGDGPPPRDRPVRAWLGFSLAYGAMVLGGHPPTIVHVSALVCVYFAFRVVSRRSDGISGRRLARFGAAVACGTLLASVQLLPFLEYYHHSSAAAAAAALGRSSAHLPPPALISFLLPYVAGSPVTGFEHVAGHLDILRVHNFNGRTGFFGVTTLYLGLLAIVLRRERIVVFYTLLAFAALCVIVGLPPLPRVIGALPVLRNIDHTRLLLVVGFAGSVLGGLGLDRLASAPAQRRRTVAFIVTWLAVSALLGWLWLRLRSVLGEPETFAFVARQVAVFLAALAVVTLTTLATGGKHRARGVCLAALTLEMLWFAHGYNPSIEASQYYPETPGIRRLREDDSVFRIIALNRILPANTGLVFGLQDVRGRDYMTVRRYEELIRGQAGDFQFMNWTSEVPAATSLLNVKYLVTHRDLQLPEQALTRVYHDEVSIYRVEPHVERAMIVRRFEVLHDASDLLSRLRSGRFEPWREVLLEEAPPPFAEADPRPYGRAGDSLRIADYAADTLTIDAHLEAPGFLVLLDTYFPGWKAYAGDDEIAIYRANYNFRAVALPAGETRVRFEYRPWTFTVGLSLSLMSAMLLGFGAWSTSRCGESGANP